MEALNKIKRLKLALEATTAMNMLEPFEYYAMCILLVTVLKVTRDGPGMLLSVTLSSVYGMGYVPCVIRVIIVVATLLYFCL